MPSPADRPAVPAGLLTTTEVSEAFRDRDPTAVLVTGSCEQHGAHLPLDTDLYLAERVAAAACASTGDLVLPALPFGYNEKELGFPGTVSVPAPVYLDLLVGLGRSLRRSGWGRLVIVNGHGWNNDLVRAATHVLNEDPQFRTACCSYWSLCLPEVRELRESPTPGGMAHGCEFETSLMLHLRPESVRTELIADEISYRRLPGLHHDLLEKSPMFMPEVFGELSATGIIGSPSLATAEKGRVWFEAAAERLSSFLLGFRDAFPRKEVA
ncbi:creatininase family protein [Actinoplanes sp. NPDC023936]|uniref:creatininase family protein n=1 Tax=Actinoplanes sp. NPDC023936 TaxID=3154910 RepID=UPI0033D4167B